MDLKSEVKKLKKRAKTTEDEDFEYDDELVLIKKKIE